MQHNKTLQIIMLMKETSSLWVVQTSKGGECMEYSINCNIYAQGDTVTQVGITYQVSGGGAT